MSSTTRPQTPMRRRLRALALGATAIGVAALATLAPAAGATGPGTPLNPRVAYTTIEGTGSTWSELIVQQWIADVDANGLKVVYTGGGSTKGRKDFSQNSVDFAISEIPYQGEDENGQADTSNGRDFAYLPIVAGGTAFTYHLEVGGELVRNLRLSGETIAKIFTQEITNWNDPQITADNNGRSFPDKAIIPVVRSDGSGTTAQFTAWMDKQYPSLWRPFAGRAGLTSFYPREGRTGIVGQSGSDQVMNTVAGFAGDGMIGYVEYAYPVNKDYPVVKVLNKAGYYVEPTQYNVAVALTKAKIDKSDPDDPSTYLTQILDGVYNNTDPRAYPVSSYSYMIIPTGSDDQRMTTSKRQTLADFLFYSLCSGQTKAGPYGYSPLPVNLVKAGFEQIGKLADADPAVDITNRDIASCNNPTFDGKNPNRNLLAEIAEQPPACDKQGEGPCGTATGQNTNNGGGDDSGDGTTTTGGDGSTTDGGTTTGGTTTTGGGTTAPGDTPGGGGAPVVDPETGAVVSTDTSTVSGDTAVFASSTTLDREPPDSGAFGLVAAVELLALVLLPGLLVAYYRRRGAGAR